VTPLTHTENPTFFVLHIFYSMTVNISESSHLYWNVYLFTFCLPSILCYSVISESPHLYRHISIQSIPCQFSINESSHLYRNIFIFSLMPSIVFWYKWILSLIPNTCLFSFWFILLYFWYKWILSLMPKYLYFLIWIRFIVFHYKWILSFIPRYPHSLLDIFSCISI
jgi:hypothetical protein